MMNLLKLNLSKVSSLNAFHEAVSEVLDFPPYYGRNKDAFWDCITDFVDETTVEIAGLDNVSEPLKAEIKNYVDMLKEYEKVSKGTFQVFVLDVA